LHPPSPDVVIRHLAATTTTTTIIIIIIIIIIINCQAITSSTPTCRHSSTLHSYTRSLSPAVSRKLQGDVVSISVVG